MILKLYAVLDVKAQAFVFPNFYSTHGQAIRSFGDSVKNPKSPLSLHPEDYSLYFLGEMDDYNGKLTAVSPAELLSRATDHLPHDPAAAAGNGRHAEREVVS